MIIDHDHADPKPRTAPSNNTTPVDQALNFTLRPTTLADAVQISSLISRTWIQTEGHTVSPADLELFLTTSVSVAQITKNIANPNARFIVAVIPSSPEATTTKPSSDAPASETKQPAENIIGVIQLTLGTSKPCLTLPQPIELKCFYVDASYHGAGVAFQLLRGAEDLARKEGGQSMWLGTWEGAARARRFYEKMGFKEVGEYSFFAGKAKKRDLCLEKGL